MTQPRTMRGEGRTMSVGQSRTHRRRGTAAEREAPYPPFAVRACAALLPVALTAMLSQVAYAAEAPTDMSARMKSDSSADTPTDEDIDRDTPDRTLDRIEVIASALPTAPAAASQHITVLRREQLDAMRGLSVADILASQAGLVNDRGTRSGGFGSLYLRGADPSHVVILVDHVRQNDPLSSRGSAVDLNALASDDIERIEIVRGNASVVNAEAMAGSIHIFTRRRGDAFGAYAGGDGLRGALGAWRGERVWANVAQREEGDRLDAFHRSRSVNGGWVQDIGDSARIEATARYADSDALGFPDDSGGARYAQVRTLESRRGDSRQFSLRMDAEAAGAQWQAQATTVSRRGDESSPGVAPGLRDPFGLPPIESHSDYRRDDYQAIWRRGFGETWMLTAGASHVRERGRYDSAIDFGGFVLPATFEIRRRTDSAFAEARWRSEAWTLQGGLRYERSDDDTATHPMLSLQRTLADGRGRWGASIARSEKRPSFYALGHPLVGDPALRAERATHREVFYANASTENDWSMRFTLFSARYQDLIDFDAGPPPRLVNRARIESDGVEWRAERRFSSDWRLQFEGAWMRVRDPVGGIELRHRPRLQLAASGAWPIGGGRELGASLRHLGRRFDSSIPTGDRWLAAATTLDFSLLQTLGPMDLRFAVDDALDRDVEETLGSRTGGRRLRVSMQWRFP
ncbi:MAG: TonB-dependent receptor [Xanthomonadaceae bacterium]|nr:TonB-dependent receptor [Xanthomonadaceae bacterium]